MSSSNSPVSSISSIPSVKKVEKTEKQILLSNVQAILAEYEGLESNIPVNHDYWNMLNSLRNMK